EGRLRRGALRGLHGPRRRQPDALVHHARTRAERGRGDDHRGPTRPPDGAIVRPRGCASVRLLRAGPDRERRRARRGDARPVERGDPTRHERQPLSLRRVSEDRGGDSHVARLIRTEKEVEGRYEEVWLVVDEDALEQWPAGPRDVVGRPATRIDGLERARGEAVYTA